MNRSSLHLLRVLPLLLISGAAFGESANPSIENVVVTATRLPSSVESIPSHVTILDRQSLERLPSRSVLDALRSVAGIHVNQIGGRGGPASLFIRGAEPNFTVVTIDGVKVNDPNDTRGGSFNFATLNLAEVERIEIIRGAQSAIYGSDALAGIINIVTRSATDDLSGLVEGEVGEDGFARLSLSASGPATSRAGFSLTASGSRDGDVIPGNDFKDSNLDGRLRYDPSAKVTVHLSGRYSDASSESFPEDSGGPRLAVLDDVDHRDQTQSSLSAAVEYAVSPGTTVRVKADYANLDNETRSPGVAPGVRDGVPPSLTHATLDRSRCDLDLAFAVSDALSAVLGMSYESESGDQKGKLELAPGFTLPTDFTLDRHLWSAFAEIQAGREHSPEASLAVRRDNPSDRATETTARVGVQYRFETTRVYANWSEGYKLPSFFALGHPLVGDPDLRPESSTSREIGVTHVAMGDRVRFTAAAFDNEYEDLIDFDPNLFKIVNRTGVTIRGAEFELQARPLESLLISAHVSHVDIDVSDNTTLLQRPDLSGGVSIEWQATRAVDLLADWIHVGEYADSSIPTGDLTLDPYDRLDMELRWRPSSRLALWLALDNVLDARYEEAIGFPALHRSARAGVRVRL